MTINRFYNERYNEVLSDRYQQLIHSHLDAICKARDGLANKQQLWDVKERLRPAECDDMMSKLRTFRESVRSFAELLKDGSKLPDGAASKRYKIFVSLSYTEEHIKQVIPLLSLFRTVCLETSRETYELLEEIRYKISRLLRVSDALEPETREMLTKTMIGSPIKLPDLPNHAKYEN